MIVMLSKVHNFLSSCQLGVWYFGHITIMFVKLRPNQQNIIGSFVSNLLSLQCVLNKIHFTAHFSHLGNVLSANRSIYGFGPNIWWKYCIETIFFHLIWVVLNKNYPKCLIFLWALMNSFIYESVHVGSCVTKKWTINFISSGLSKKKKK